MTPFRITAKARSDLKGIGRFTQCRWGRDGRAAYLDRIESACIQLAANSSLGRHREEFPNDIRIFPVARHLIIYHVEADGRIIIIRVLHPSMDYQGKL